MLRIVFKNMASSDLIKEVVTERIESVINKYPVLKGKKVTLTLEMENSPTQAGPDSFSVSSMIHSKPFNGLKLKRSSKNFYHAIAELADGLNEILSSESDRISRKRRNREKLYA